ncbi:MAG: cupin domain-containing protein [Pseudohongiellaceae bacterium]|nr:cupin domain-containing protein [Pseudohongiellaceae bacterium]
MKEAVSQLGNLLAHLPPRGDSEVIETLLQQQGITVERIVSTGQCSEEGFWYEQERNEWVLLVQGSARLAWEDGSETALQAGDYVFIPALKRHRVAWTDPQATTIWLAIFFV